MLKLTGGEFRGRNIECPPGRDIRPTSSKTRQGIFNTLFSMGFEAEGSVVLELFAGTGLMSFEAISRGAKNAVLVDMAKSSLDVISKNADKLKINDKVKLVRNDAIAFVEHSDLSSYDLVYLDPPYKYGNYGELLSKMIPNVSSHTIVIAESDKEISNDIKVPVELVKVKNWGKSKAFFFRKK
jgi:16S rRNA (guanine966-N2)-methyltransferase